MIKLNGKKVDINHFPDGTFLLRQLVSMEERATLTWLFEHNEEMAALYFITKHLQEKGVRNIELQLPYIPNARQDRVKTEEDVFTLKYFAQFINSLQFSRVTVLDPHSYVSEALIDNINIRTPERYVKLVLDKLKEHGNDNILLFFPDEGAMKRYASMFELQYVFGIKKRDWKTGQIQGLDVAGQTELIKDRAVLIVDDICSRGGTFYRSAKALRELGAKKVYLYISHCENSILEGELLEDDLIERVYTTDSIFTKTHDKVEVFSYE